MDPLNICYWTVICTQVSCKKALYATEIKKRGSLITSRQVNARLQKGCNIINVCKVKLVVSMNKHSNVY